MLPHSPAGIGVLDAHLHVWDLNRAAYPWLGPQLGPINRTVGIDEVLPEMRGAGVDSAILVQAADNDDDTDHMLEVAASHPHIVGVVAYVPLEHPDRAAVRLAELRKNPLVVGIRNLIHDQPDPDWVIRPDVRHGLDLVAESGLPFDLVAVLPRHLEHVPTLRERHPDLPIVIDHLGKPPVKNLDGGPWKSLIATAATIPGVFAKFSGLYPPTGDPTDWTAADLAPVLAHALESFGADRLMFGSDWPILQTAGGYRKVWREISAVLQDVNDADREHILHGTATTFYRIAAS